MSEYPMQRAFAELQRRERALSDQVAEVRALHVPRQSLIGVCKECARDYPCATIRALDREQR